MSQQPDPANPIPLEPLVGALRVVAGVRREDVGPCVAALPQPAQVARGREGERLFVLLDVNGPASPHLYRELREIAVQAYWATEGSTTAALRQAAAAVNRHLFRSNLYTAPASRCYGGLTCAVLRDEDLFILQAGSACACVLRGYPERGEVPPLGTSTLADVRLYHTFATLGDTLLLASPALLRAADTEAVTRALARDSVQEVLASLEQVGAGGDFAALVARWAVSATRETVQPVSRPRTLPLQQRPRPAELQPTARIPPESTAEPPRLVEPRERPVSQPLISPRPLRRPSPGPGRRLRGIAAAAGRGIATLGAGLVGGARTLFRRMLPGPEWEARRRARPPRVVPKENRTVMMSIAIGLLVIVITVVLLAYNTFGREARYQSLISQARQEAVLAQAAVGTPEEARSHWQAVLGYAGRAIGERPNDVEAATLRTQAQAALDALDGIVRLEPVQLTDLGPGSVPRQVVLHAQTLFVLDPMAGWVEQLTLNQTGDSIVEQGELPIVRTGQAIDNATVGNLVDCTWVDAGNGRQTSGLVVLEEGGALVTTDPAWATEGGRPQLKRSFLGTPPSGIPRAIASYDGRLYILDPMKEQLLLYRPQGDTYPDPPDNYFVTSPPRSLAAALDLAIDGNVYILFADGEILKYRASEPQPFQVRGVPDPISQTVALAVDPFGTSGAVYVADRGGQRIVVLGPDGAFQRQFRAVAAFDALEALAVNETTRRLYVLSQGRLYMASLP